MPARKRDSKVYASAKREAELQFRDLLHEARLLVELFPHLRDSVDPDELPLSFIMAKGSGRLTKKTAGRGSRKKAPAKRKGATRRAKT